MRVVSLIFSLVVELREQIADPLDISNANQQLHGTAFILETLTFAC
jgi:hypothetical protein